MTRIYLFRGKHPLYETLLTDPPEGVEYFPRRPQEAVEEYKLYNIRNSTVRRMAAAVYGSIGIPRIVPIFTSCDLVHSSRGFFVFGPKPYVVDIEHVASFLGMNYARLSSPRNRKILGSWLRSSRCRGILPHCEAARKTVTLVTDEKSVLDKTSVVYPTVSVEGRKERSSSKDKPEVLFIGEYYWKGGREVIEACMKLSNKLDFRLTYITIRVPPPDPVVKKAREALDFNYHAEPIPRKELLERVYPNADIFVMPTYLDTFGYVFLEAMAFGIPCIGANHFAVPEIVENEVSGILVDPPVSYFDARGMGHPEIVVESLDTSRMTDEIRASLERLISSTSLRQKMGAAGFAAVSRGRFSVGSRNRILKEVYEKCLRY